MGLCRSIPRAVVLRKADEIRGVWQADFGEDQ